ncbi:MAG: serine hydrolase domain-containing protein [Pirellulales bacterium]
MTFILRSSKRAALATGILAAVLSAASVYGASPESAEARREQVVQAIAAGMKAHEVPGVSIAVVEDYQIDWADGYGVSKAGESQAVTPTTLFQAASISKPVAALAAMRTVELGKLALDDDVDQRLTSWHIPASPLSAGRPVTLRRLLSHTAGLTVHGFPGYASDQSVPTLLQVLFGSPPANTAPVKLLVKPGYMFKYSGGGYSVVQQLLIDVTGLPFPDYVRQQVLEPLGMSDSTYEQPLPVNLRDRAAIAHREHAAPIPGGWHVYPEMAAAGLWTTPSDLAKVVIEVAGSAAGRTGKVLSNGMVVEMLKPQLGKYGLGFAVRGEDRAFTFSHGGSNEGYRCLLIGVPATGQGCVIMTNSDTGGALLPEVAAAVSQAYEWPSEK